MKPNSIGGVTYEGREIPVVIAAAAYHDEEFAEYLTEAAEQRLHQQKREASGVSFNPLEMPRIFGPGNISEVMETVNNTKVKTPELPLYTEDTTRTYGNLMDSLDAGLLLRSQRPIARGILIEAGLVDPTFRERLTGFKLARAIFRQSRQ